MSHAQSSLITKHRHKKILKLAKGYRGRSSKCYRIALQRVEKALQYAYRDRRNRRREFRSLWIQRINAAVRQHGIVYSKFIACLKKSQIDINRKILSDLAITQPEAFNAIITQVI